MSERFWTHVNKTDTCWFFTVGIDEWGYGRIRVDTGKMTRAHRLVWEWANGPIPDDKMVLHSCDHPNCVRLEHLFLGTAMDNVQDMIRKGRQAPPRRGEDHPNHKLTEEDVRDILRRHATGKVTTVALAAEYDVAQNLIFMIVKRKIWKHVEAPSDSSPTSPGV